MKIHIDVTEIEDYAKKLQSLHRKHLPAAVRGTLSSAAFDVKKTTLQQSSKKNFTNRDNQFFKKFSTVEKAKGWDIDLMQSTVGMHEQGLKGNRNHAVKDLEEQEEGGRIKSKTFIPMNPARVGNSPNKRVRGTSRVSNIKNKRLTPMNRKSASTRQQQFVRAAIYAVQHEDGLVLGMRTKKGGRTLWRIDRIKSNIRSRRIDIKSTAIYNVKDSRSVKVQPTRFMREAAVKSARKIPALFKKEAEFQIRKAYGIK